MQLLSVIFLIISHSFTERYPKENPVTKTKNVVESFVEKVFQIQLQMNGADLKKVNFSTGDLYKNPGKFSRIEFYKNVEPIDSSIAWKMEFSEGVITMSKMDEESGCGIRIFLLEDRIYFSVFNFASRFTEHINLRAGKVKPLKYYVKSVNKAIAIVGDDYTDPRGVDHPQYQGHIWREARLNIRTNKISRWRILDY
jgi:hypothetical protein